VLCTRQRPALAERCLRALRDLDEQDVELVVVDNTRGDPATRRAAFEAGARYLAVEQAGVSRARNAGARVANGRFVAFIDDDAVPAPDWLTHHRAALEADATLSATTGRVLPGLAGSPQATAYAAVGVEDLGPSAFRVDSSSERWFERAHFGGVGVGPNMVLQRQLFAAGWGFREHLGWNFGLAGEEHYAFYSLIRDGGAIGYVPEAIVYHDPPATPEALRERRLRVARSSAAYVFMLIVEERGHRRQALLYALTAVRGSRRNWRGAEATKPIASRGELVTAAVLAPLLYARARLRATR
jgi:glycosyltransferase involved in cell wall biosynthesis